MKAPSPFHNTRLGYVVVFIGSKNPAISCRVKCAYTAVHSPLETVEVAIPITVMEHGAIGHERRPFIRPVGYNRRRPARVHVFDNSFCTARPAAITGLLVLISARGHCDVES